MEVKILEVATHELVDAFVRKGKPGELPSLHDEWRFNFGKQLKRLSYTTAYVLVTTADPNVIEGCMLFQMKDNMIPYLAFIEVAPHNLGKHKMYDHVAGCLIAFAFKQSYIQGNNDYKGILFFDVMEANEEDAKRLMLNYSIKYRARHYHGTCMVIMDDDGDALIADYLPEPNN